MCDMCDFYVQGMFYVLITKNLDVSSHRYHLSQSFVIKYEKLLQDTLPLYLKYKSWFPYFLLPLEIIVV